MTRKKTNFDYHCYFRYAQRIPIELSSVPVGEFVDEVIPQELVWDRTPFGLVLLVKESDAFRKLADPGLVITSKPVLFSGLNLSTYYHCQLDKSFYHGLRSLVSKYSPKVTEGLEFYALNGGAGAYAPLDWHQEAFKKGLEKVILDCSTEPKTASSSS